MAKLIKKHFAMLESVELIHPSQDLTECSWRKKYEGICGSIHVYENEKKSPQNNFVVICDSEANYLQTSVGSLHYDGDSAMILITKNSKYTFKLSKEILRREHD